MEFNVETISAALGAFGIGGAANWAYKKWFAAKLDIDKKKADVEIKKADADIKQEDKLIDFITNDLKSTLNEIKGSCGMTKDVSRVLNEISNKCDKASARLSVNHNVMTEIMNAIEDLNGRVQVLSEKEAKSIELQAAINKSLAEVSAILQTLVKILPKSKDKPDE